MVVADIFHPLLEGLKALLEDLILIQSHLLQGQDLVFIINIKRVYLNILLILK